MQLPTWLRDAIADIAADVPQRDLARATADLSDAYRSGDFSRAPLDSHARRVAYLAQRLPATYAACAKVFEEIRVLAPDVSPKSTLDLGAGPATATMAAVDSWPTIGRATLIERDAPLIELGQRLLQSQDASRGDAASRASTSYVLADLRKIATEVRVAPHDLVIVSYALGEFSKAEQLAAAAWAAASQFLAIVEPGTRRGFENILKARDALGLRGAHILAPCPRSGPHACPMAEAGDWCHFSRRVERTALHRRLKGGELGYEDEKFSYVVLSRQPLPTAPSRIVRHPAIRKGHVELQLCAPDGLHRVTVGKSQKDRYRAARKAEWGDAFIGESGNR